MRSPSVRLGRCLLPCLLAFAAASLAADDLVAALRLPTESAELRALAARQQLPVLRAALADANATRRRGAARLLAASPGLPANDLLTAIAINDDAEVRRLGAAGLIGRLDGVAPAALLALRDPAIVCLLLGQHPLPAALDDPAVAAQVRGWLADPAGAEAAAGLVAARGTAAAWGQALVAALAHRDAGVVSAAHQALCVLTRTQRGLAAYAGHHDLLAKDWNDALAALAVTGGQAAPDAELAGLISELPQAEALAGLLAKGPSALPAVESAMAGGDRTRRKQLAVAARLLARLVTPALWRALGEAGLAGMDAESTRDRLACLAAAAEQVKTLRDRRGLLHLLTYTDDRDPGVRAAAFDRLVRLSDDRRVFGGDWKLADDGLFPPAQALWRLRRAFKQGGADEQVSAMQLAASLEAKDLASDVAGLLFAPQSAVVDTAIEALGHLGSEQSAPALLRLAEDAHQPAPRRVKLIELASKGGRSRPWDEDGREARPAAPDPVQAALERLAKAADAPGVAVAAQRALVQRASGGRKAELMLDLLAGTPAERAAALDLMRRDDDLAHLAVPAVFADDQAVARAATAVVVEYLGERRTRRSYDRSKPPTFDAQQRLHLVELAGQAGELRPLRLALCIELGLIGRAKAIAAARGLKAEDSAPLWRSLSGTGTVGGALGEVLAAQADGQAIEDLALWHLVRRVLGEGLLAPSLLAEIAAAGAVDALHPADTDSDFSGNGYTRTLTLGGGRTLKLRQERPQRSGSWSPDEGPMTVVEAPKDAPDDAALAGLRDGLAKLKIGEARAAAYRDLALSVLARTSPPEGAEQDWDDHDELWALLAARDPAVRARLVAAITAQGKDVHAWSLRRFLKPGESDLLPVVAWVLAGRQDDHVDDRLMGWLASLPAAALLPHLPRLLANPTVARHQAMTGLLRGLDPMPATVAFALLGAAQPLGPRLAAYGETEAPALRTTLLALGPDAVLAAGADLRRLREAGAGVFDGVLADLVARDDATAAAWLRTGIPLQAGMQGAYERALASPVPELWLVGAALALKEGRLPIRDFLARAAALPAGAQANAALVSGRYLEGKLAGEGAALADLLRRCPARALPAWLALCPPAGELGPVLVERVKDPAVANLIAFALATHLRKDRDGWLPVAQAVVTAAGGRLDYLLPAGERSP